MVIGALHMLVACAGASTHSPTAAPAAAFSLHTTPLAPQSGTCSDQFARTDLPHQTTGDAGGSALYASNGSGVAVGDLDNDGRLDIVYGNITGTVTIFMNQGDMQFTPVHTDLTDVRALAIVDTDGDGQREIVATRRFAAPVIGRPAGGTYAFTPIPDVYTAFYAMGWHDLDSDGRLDAVFGTYDNEQLKTQGLIFQTRGGGGVFVYTATATGYRAARLSDNAQALAIAFPDLDRDGHADIYVGNDFNTPDHAWRNTAAGYVAAAPFSQTTENTMSLDYADTNNDGEIDLYATDMKPFDQDVATLARWLPAMGKLTRPLSADDPQYTENTLYRWDGKGWDNTAYEQQLDATGWSWSATFADLDDNGWQDLYVVNGMKATDLLGYLPNSEIAEADMLFATDDGVSYTIAQRGLENTGSGRAAVMADLDGDGDLDVAVNPIDGPAQLYENHLCGTQRLLVTLVDPTTANRDAIGAEARLETAAATQTRTVAVMRGYLSGYATTQHFGLGDATAVGPLVIRWPDGAESTITDVPVDQHLVITRKAAP